MERDQAIRLTQNLLKKMVESDGSDLFITADFPPAIKIDGVIQPFADKPLTREQSALIVRSIMNDKQSREFDATNECNFAIAPQGIGRFRVSAFVAQSNTGAVLRTISFSAAGNTSTMRSTVFAAELVCSVTNTKWPVSAAVSASLMVSRSRISPTRMTSGSSRRAERSASLKPRVSRWTSR